MRTIVIMGMFCSVFGLIRAQNITRAEYFFDTDPGVGKASMVAVSNPQDSVDASFTIPISYPGKGFHKLAVRVYNANGTWSFNETRSFYVLDNAVVVLPGNVLAYEYFIDTDPGLGKATKGSIADTANISFTIPVTGMKPGFHVAGMRLFDSNNAWSENETRIFYILPDAPVNPATTVTGAEYFIDTDPGLGKATVVPSVTAGDSVVMNITSSIASLSPGFHKLMVRAKNSLGNWGMQDARVFYIDSSYQFKRVPIIESEYYLDTDPGQGKATQITPLTPGDSITQNFSINVSTWTIGSHKMVVRVKDSTGLWSLPEIRNITIKDSTATATGVATIGSGNDGLIIYPNPVPDILNIKVDLSGSPNATIDIFDNAGRKVQEMLIGHVPAGSNLVSFNVSNLKPGIYILDIRTSELSKSVYFVKK